MHGNDGLKHLIFWNERVANNGSVAVMVNDHLETYSKTLRRVRQGDVLSPILFA
jgi:hypothetical protein